MTGSINYLAVASRVVLVGATLSLGCGPTGAMRTDIPAAATRNTGSIDGADASGLDPIEEKRLNNLWARRSRQASAGHNDYPIGSGDVLSISVPEVNEISDRKVRVSAQGTIKLPLIGVIRAAGLTDDGLARELDDQLQQYMFKPQASVFVDEYRNREVAVVGAVNKPGVIVIDSPTETILDVLTQAGGVAPTAADELVLIPGDERASTSKPTIDGNSKESPSLAIAKSAHALSISLQSTSLTGSGRFLNLPVRPGDVIVVPGGGQVMVVGWVQYPGHFEVGSGLTVLGAIGEAGGPMYAANTKDITLIRSEKDGAKSTTRLDLQKISHGESVDIPVKANDVIDVPYSNWRIAPYIFYSVAARIGIMGPAIPY